LTLDFGDTWTDITGNLYQAVGALYDVKLRSCYVMTLSGTERAYLVRPT
jgi:hypothetical protein